MARPRDPLDAGPGRGPRRPWPGRRVWKLAAAVAAVALFALGPVGLARAQSSVSGAVAGVVTDPTGAAIPNANITIIDPATGASRTATSGAHGNYNFALLQPATYVISVTASGFAPKQIRAVVAVGQTATANIELAVGTATQTVEVTGEAAPIQTSNANISSNFSAAKVASLPNGGGDLTMMIQSAPGMMMNTQGGNGNFSAFGMSGTANLFTINGEPDNDPYMNLNNSGPTNLMLGASAVQEVSVTNNAYSGQFGGFSGAQVNYVTKSGTNNFHGTAIYNWNGRAMNANDFFNNANGTARPFVNVNNWSAGFGGPIFKSKTFFFVNTDGLYVEIPTSTQALIPSPAFQAATLANLTATGAGAQVPFYQQLFKYYNNAAGAAHAQPLAGGNMGCGDFSADPLGAGNPCSLFFYSAAGNQTHEWDLAARVDQHFGSNDTGYFRYSVDRGVQATFTDPLSPVFNASSIQPEYSAQAGWTHSASSGWVNQMNASVNHYSAIFKNVEATPSLPMTIAFSFGDGALTDLGGENEFFPQGRIVSQFSYRDDLSMIHGNQTWKAGFDWTMNRINDYGFGVLTTPLVGETLSNFYNGQAFFSEQSFPTTTNQPVNMYRLGTYLEDDIQVTPALETTITLRLEHHSNPICLHDCVAALAQPFPELDHDASIPYNQIIRTGLRQGFPSTEEFLWQPRIGFAWTPFASQKTVLRGGFGIFNDTMPGLIMDSMMENAPFDNTFVVGGAIAPANVAGSVLANAANSNAAFVSGFHNGENVNQIEAGVPAFVPPGFFSTAQKVQPAREYEYNLEVQQQVGANTAVMANYVGHHGVHEPIENNSVNAFDPGFLGLPATAPDPRFGTVTQLEDSAISNYNGLVLSVNHRLSRSFSLQASYTWSHTLDEVSNGGFLGFGGTTIGNPQDPNDIRRYNYGNAAYDLRNYFNVNYLWNIPLNQWLGGGAKALTQGWSVAGTLYTHSGFPFTVVDNVESGALSQQNYGATIFANPVSTSGSGQTGACGPDGKCLNVNAFTPAGTETGFGNQMRNQFRGPKFFDTDMSIYKATNIPGWESAQLKIGFQFFNLFNHPNFASPNSNIGSTQFGSVLSTVSVPTSIFGSFLGGDASTRAVEFTSALTF